MWEMSTLNLRGKSPGCKNSTSTGQLLDEWDQGPSNPPRKACLEPCRKVRISGVLWEKWKEYRERLSLSSAPRWGSSKREETHGLSAAVPSKGSINSRLREVLRLPRSQQVSTSTRTRLCFLAPVLSICFGLFVCSHYILLLSNSSQKLGWPGPWPDCHSHLWDFGQKSVSLAQSGNNNICPTDLSLLKVIWNNGSERTSKHWKRDRQKERKERKRKGKSRERNEKGRKQREGLLLLEIALFSY